MIERVGFLYLLLTLGVRNTKEYGGDKKGNRTNPESSQNDDSSCSKVMKDIKIYSPTPEITIGANVTVVCYWETDHCLPINYTLFLNIRRVQGPVLQSTKEQKVLFNTTIHSNSQLGLYKCKAGYMREEAYGPGFNFTLKESSQNASSCSKDIKIYSPTPEITIGANVTVVCYWETDHCLPINYTLFLNKGRVQGPVLQSTKEQKVLFNTTIHSNSQLGPYKCKAGYMREEAYGPGFNFTLKATKKNLALFIVLPLILLLLLIAAVVTIRLLIFPWCKARKLKSADICTAYNETDYETADYCNLKMKTKTDDRNVNDYEDSTITYAEVICK